MSVCLNALLFIGPWKCDFSLGYDKSYLSIKLCSVNKIYGIDKTVFSHVFLQECTTCGNIQLCLSHIISVSRLPAKQLSTFFKQIPNGWLLKLSKKTFFAVDSWMSSFVLFLGSTYRRLIFYRSIYGLSTHHLGFSHVMTHDSVHSIGCSMWLAFKINNRPNLTDEITDS